MKLIQIFLSVLLFASAVSAGRSITGLISDPKINEFSTLDSSEQRVRVPSLGSSRVASNVNLAAAFEAGQGERAVTAPDKIRSWCAALGLYGRSLKLAPFNSRTLLNWANLRQLLGSTECAEPFTNGSFAEVAKFALDQDPSNVNNRYIAGLLLFWAGDLQRASEEFNFVLRYGVALDELRRNQMFAIASRPELLTSVVPARIPQAVQYLHWFEQQKKKGDFWSEALVESGAVDKLKQSLFTFLDSSTADKSLPRPLLIDQLQQLEKVTLTANEVQQLSQLYLKLLAPDEQNGFTEMLKLRSLLRAIPVQLGFLSIDTRTLKTPIVRWGLHQEGILDSYHASIGIFTRNGDVPKNIEIHCGFLPSIEMQAEQLRLYLSEDNLSFRDVTDEAKIAPVRNGLETIFTIDTSRLSTSSAPKGRFWKIHFNGTSRQAICRGPLSSLVRTFGTANAPILADES